MICVHIQRASCVLTLTVIFLSQTLIECLKFVTTGNLPPGSEKGQAFVHDPKVLSERETKGKITLQFKDPLGNKVSVTRTLQVATKPSNKLEFKQIDGFIDLVYLNGERKQINTRGSDFNTMVPELLGVSKSIISNVIFCHQEDSNWPLYEPKLLKVKFDEIFSLNAYTKAFENLKEQLKNLNDERKQLRLELDTLQERRSRVLRLRDGCHSKRAEIQSEDQTISHLHSTIEQKSTEHDQLRLRVAASRKGLEEIRHLRALIEEKTIQNERIKSLLSSEFTEDDDELFARRSNVQHQKREALRQKEELDQTRISLQSHISHLQISLEEARRKTNHSQSDFDRHLSQLQQLKDDISRFCNQNSAVFDSVLSEPNIQNIIMSFDATCLDDTTRKQIALAFSLCASLQSKLEQSLADLSNDHLHQLKTTDDRIHDLIVDFRTKDNEKKSLLQQLEAKRLRIESLKQMSENSQTLLDSLLLWESQLVQVVKEFDSIVSEKLIDTLNQQQLQLSLQIGETRAFLSQLRSESEKAIKTVTQRSKLSLLCETWKKGLLHLSSLSQSISTHRRSSSHSLTLDVEELTSRPAANLALSSSDVISSLRNLTLESDFSTLLSQKRAEIDAALRVFKSEENKKLNLEAEIGFLKNQLSQKKAIAQDLMSEITTINSSLSVSNSAMEAETIHDNEIQIEQILEEHAFLKSLQVTYSTYIDDAISSSKCPLCERSFASQHEQDHFKSKLNETLLEIPSQIDLSNQSLKSLRERRKQYQEVLPKLAEKKAVDSEISDLESKICSNSLSLTNINVSLSGLRRELERTQSDLEEMSGEYQQLIRSFSQAVNEMRELDHEIGLFFLSTGITTTHQNESFRPLEDINANISLMQDQLDQQEKQMQSLSQQKDEISARLSSLSERKHKLSEQITEAKSFPETNSYIQVQIEDLHSSTSQLASSITHLEKDISDIDSLVQGEQRKRLLLEKDLNEAQREVKSTLDVFKSSLYQLTSDFSRIDAVNFPLLQSQLEVHKATADRISESLQQASKELESVLAKITPLFEQIPKFDHLEKDISSFCNYRMSLREIESSRQQLNLMQQQQQGHESQDVEQLDQQLQMADSFLLKMKREESERKGRLQILQRELSQTEQELADLSHHLIDKDYKSKVIELKTTDLLCDDVLKYSQYLDKSLSKFHAEKITEINKILYELWTSTYKGNDIDRIELRSDVETSVGRNARSYNYGVIMVKGDTELDMRSRCSAGQRVLAALLIRLALAESFCLKCGIIALDEPTTNLDRANMESFANALISIVETRRYQHSFQILIITHDEEFVRMLGGSEQVDYFWKISKDQEKCSMITRHDIADLSF